MERKILCLRNIDLYQGISEKELIAITQEAVEGAFPKGTVFYAPNNPAKDVFVIKEGEVELYRDEDGKKIIIETLMPGDVFGDFGTHHTNHIAIATRGCYICKTPTKEFLDVVRTHPEVALNLMQALAIKTEEYENRIATLARPAKEQLYEELKRLHTKNQRRVFGKIFNINLSISHRKLAEKTGLNRVTVTKLMGELRHEGRIIINEKTNAIKIV